MADMDETQKKAFDFAADLTKQLMTFATAILTFTAAFGKEVAPDAPWYQKGFVIGSWIFYILSIACGVFTLMGLTGNLDPQPERKRDPADRKKWIITPKRPDVTINSDNVLPTSKWQFYFFLLAIALTAGYGYNLLFPPKTESAKQVVIVHDGRIEGDSFHSRDTVAFPK